MNYNPYQSYKTEEDSKKEEFEIKLKEEVEKRVKEKEEKIKEEFEI